MIRSTATGLAAIALLTACSENTTPIVAPIEPDPLAGDSVATVNTKPIPTALLEQLSLSVAQRDAAALTPEQRGQLVEQLILMQVLAEAAEDQGLHRQRDLAAQLAFQRLQALARAATDSFLNRNSPTEAELRQAYEENLPRYLAKQFKARHILVSTEEQARELIAELDGGADFATLAREHSTGPTGPRGGDLDWFTAESMVEPFADAVRVAAVGVHTPEPVQTRFGWHVILVEDTREQQAPGLEAVRDELVGIVERSKLDAYVTSLREAAVVVQDD